MNTAKCFIQLYGIGIAGTTTCQANGNLTKQNYSLPIYQSSTSLLNGCVNSVSLKHLLKWFKIFIEGEEFVRLFVLIVYSCLFVVCDYCYSTPPCVVFGRLAVIRVVFWRRLNVNHVVIMALQTVDKRQNTDWDWT